VRPVQPASPLAEEPWPLGVRVRSLARLGARHRRLLAALFAASAVFVTVSALTPTAPTAAEDAAGADGGRSAATGLPAGAGALAPGAAARVAVAVRLADPAGLLLLRPGDHAEVLASAPDPGWPVAGAAEASGGDGATRPAQGEVLAGDAVVLAVPGAGGPSPAGWGGGSGAAPAGGRGGLLGDMTGGTVGVGNGATGLDGVILLAVTPADARRLAAAGGRSVSVAVALPAQTEPAP